MQTDEQKRAGFVTFLRQLKEKWTIDSEAERNIMIAILSHKDSELDIYIIKFERMISFMLNGINNQPDKYSKAPPPDGKCIESLVVSRITSRNCNLSLFFSKKEHRIYRFEIWSKAYTKT